MWSAWCRYSLRQRVKAYLASQLSTLGLGRFRLKQEIHMTTLRLIALVAFALAVATSPALALTAGTYYVGLDTSSHTCSVVTKMAPGMKMMGKYKSKEAAEKAMAGMKKCHA